ncbi:MAG: hypothetical protein OXM01_07290 [Gemmatimonadota bacterium]|nr:hypothetical protein [Gemmatimonadota bacterium]
MNRRARLRTQNQGRLIHYYRDVEPRDRLDGYEPDFTFTRIWMGIAPPEGEAPGYCCVVGEKHTPEQVWDKGSFVVVDEVASLQPADFPELTSQQQTSFDITVANARHPTQEALRDAAIALKDLYKPQLCWCVPEPKAFIAYLRRGEGLSWYDYRTWHLWERKFPLVKERSWVSGVMRERVPKDPHTVGIVGDGDEVPSEDRAYGLVEVNSLLAEGRLEIVRYNHYDEAGNATEFPSLFRERRDQWPSIYRALSWVIFNMRNNPR